MTILSILFNIITGFVLKCIVFFFTCFFVLRKQVLILLIMPGGHSGEEIPVPIPNTEVKLSNADDTAERWESR